MKRYKNGKVTFSREDIMAALGMVDPEPQPDEPVRFRTAYGYKWHDALNPAAQRGFCGVKLEGPRELVVTNDPRADHRRCGACVRIDQEAGA